MGADDPSINLKYVPTYQAWRKGPQLQVGCKTPTATNGIPQITKNRDEFGDLIADNSQKMANPHQSKLKGI
jgi:hypothetical protein